MTLSVQQGRPGWPVLYPIRIYNGRPIPVDIIGYNLTALWNDEVVQREEWVAPDAETRSGELVHPPIDRSASVEGLTVQADDWYRLDIPVKVSQIANWPLISPTWDARGTIIVRCGEQTRNIQFNFDTDHYTLSERDWAGLRNHILPDGG